MKFKTIQASAFRSTFEVLKDILNDVNIYFDDTGMRILTLDTARAALVDISMTSDNFEEYTCVKPVYAGINITNMFKLLKTISNNDILTMEIKSAEYIDILIENPQKNTNTSFKLKLLDIDEDRIQVPAIKMAVITTIPSSDFQRICRDMNNLATEVHIDRTNDTFTIRCEGDFAKQKTVIQCNSSVDDAFTGSICGTYSLKYLNLFTKATGMCSILQILQETDSRFMVLKYNIANLGELKFYLATKIEDT
jgi:proliferating cell nuclear antigen